MPYAPNPYARRVTTSNILRAQERSRARQEAARRAAEAANNDDKEKTNG